MTWKINVFKCPPSLMTIGEKVNLQPSDWTAHLQLFMGFFDSFSIFLLPPFMTIFTKISKCFPIKKEQGSSCKWIVLSYFVRGQKAASHLSNIWASSIGENTILMRNVSQNKQKVRRLTKWHRLSYWPWLTWWMAFWHGSTVFLLIQKSSKKKKRKTFRSGSF